MSKYEAIGDLFKHYLNERSGEFQTRKGWRSIQLYNGDNVPILDRIKAQFCAMHGLNATEINTRWALGKGMTDYCMEWLV